MSSTNSLQKIVQSVSSQRPPESEKLPSPPPSNRQVVEALHEYFETLLAERFPYTSLIKLLEEQGVHLSVSTLKTYLRECRKAQTTNGETIVSNSDTLSTTANQERGSRKEEATTTTSASVIARQTAATLQTALPAHDNGFPLRRPISPQDI